MLINRSTCVDLCLDIVSSTDAAVITHVIPTDAEITVKRLKKLSYLVKLVTAVQLAPGWQLRQIPMNSNRETSPSDWCQIEENLIRRSFR
jgi:hypothetical protein